MNPHGQRTRPNGRGPVPTAPTNNGGDRGRRERPKKLIYIAVMGSTGSGKSAFVNKASGKDENTVGHGQRSQTRGIQETAFELGDYTVVLIDTPGFDDTTMSDGRVLEKIATWMQVNYESSFRLTGIIWLRDINETRMRGTALRYLHTFCHLCGSDNLRNVVLATTKWDTVHTEVARRREHELRGDFWKAMLHAGCRIERHNNTTASARAIIEGMIPQGERVFAIQKELVDDKKPLADTRAGQHLSGELQKAKGDVESELRKVQETLETERQRNDRNRVAMESLQERITELEEEKQALRNDRKRLSKDRTKDKKKMYLMSRKTREKAGVRERAAGWVLELLTTGMVTVRR